MRNKMLRFLVLLFSVTVAQAESLPMIDTHMHFESVPYMDLDGSRKTALAEMDRRNIRMSLLMSPPRDSFVAKRNQDVEELMPAVKDAPGRFAVLGGGGSLTIMINAVSADTVNDERRSEFRQRAERILALGAVGFGEMFIQHLSLPAMGPGHAYENVPADHPLLMLLADIAAEHDVPIDMHFDMVPQDMPLPPNLMSHSPPNPAQLTGNRGAFEALLSHNLKAKFVWAHVGFEPLLTRGPAVVREMLQAHPNLYMSFRLNRGGPMHPMALDEDGRLKDEWLLLIREFPDRFMLGSDAFYAAGERVARGASSQGLDNLRGLVDQLPPDLARRVASDNAALIYKLKFPSGN